MRKIFILIILVSYSGFGQNVFYNFPQNRQFYQRDSLGFSNVNIFGSVADEEYQAIKLTIRQDGKLYFEKKIDLKESKKFSWNPVLTSGLFEYDFELKLFHENDSSLIAKASKVLSGDTYLIYGQSNAAAACCFETFWKEMDDTFLRNFVFDHFNPSSSNNGWHDLGVEFNWPGVLGSRIAKNIISTNHIPVQIINGAVGGQSLEALSERDSLDPENSDRYYGRFLRRILASGSTRPKGFIFSQGEWEADTGLPEAIEAYSERFKKLISDLNADGVKPDDFYLVQTNILTRSDEQEAPAKLRDLQRMLKDDFPEMNMYAAFGKELSGDGLHYSRLGYEAIADDVFLGISKETYGKSTDSPVTGPLIQKVVVSAEEHKLTMVFDKGQTLNVENLIDYGHYQRRFNDYVYDASGQPFIDSAYANANEVELFFSKDFSKGFITYLPSVFTDAFSLSYDGPLIKNKNGLPALSFYRFKTCNALDKPIISSFSSDASGLSLFVDRKFECNSCTYELLGKTEDGFDFKPLGSLPYFGDSLYVDLSWSENARKILLKIKIVSNECQSDYASFEINKCPLEELRDRLPVVSEEFVGADAHKLISSGKNELIINPPKFGKPSIKTEGGGKGALFNKIGQCVNN